MRGRDGEPSRPIRVAKAKSKPKSKPETRSKPKPEPRSESESKPPSEAELLARIPVALGRKLESVRTFLCKQRGVSESLFFFGPKTGWAYRYLRGDQSVATVMLHADQPHGIVALDREALAKVDFAALSPVALAARKAAHGSPSLSWLHVPLDGTGAADFKVLVKAKLRTMPVPTSAPPPPEPPAKAGAPAPRAPRLRANRSSG